MNRLHPTAPSFRLTLVAGAATSLLIACGGGGDADSGTPPVTTVQLTTRVVDGPIANALVCLDKNASFGCEAGEPQARSATDGWATLTVEQADVGKYALVAIVDTDALDAEHGPVTQPFVMSAPADATAAITPLSTLVASYAAANRLGTADAERTVGEEAGIAHTMTGDFTAISDATQRAEAAALARGVALALQAGRAAVQPAVGQPDLSGAAMSQGAVDAANAGAVTAMLQPLVVVAREAARQTGATPAQRDQALQAAVQTAVAAHHRLTSGNVAIAVAAGKPPETVHTPSAGTSLAWFTYTDSGNWFFRDFGSTLAQDTPDAGGVLRYTERRRSAGNGQAIDWGSDPSFTRTDVYWTGSRWFACATDHVHSHTVPDASGVRDSTYCDSYRSTSTRRVVDIAGRTLASVVAQIRRHPLPSTQGSFAQWGPDPTLPALQTATFPAGSTLRYQTTVQTENPLAYNPIPANRVFVYSGPVVAGQQGACSVTQTPAVATTLEQLVAASPGTPCVYAANAANGSRNEWWGNGVASMGFDVEVPQPELPIYRAARAIRVSFSGTGAATYYTCARYASNGSVRNCDAIGTGTYSIQTLADGRILQLTNQPSAWAPQGFQRVFVEREGTVWFGFRSCLSTDNTVRLNGPATDALFAPLGVTR